MRCIASSSAVDPVRSSLPRPVTRVPASRVARLYAVTPIPTCTPRATSPAESVPNHAVFAAIGFVRAESRGTNAPRNDGATLPPASRSKCSIAGCPSHAVATTPPRRPSRTVPSPLIPSTSNETSSICAMNATESRSGPTPTMRFPAVSVTATAFAHAGNNAVIASRTRNSCPGTPGKSAICEKVRSASSYLSRRAKRTRTVSARGVIHVS